MVIDLRAVDRALALASKLFIAILPLSILCTAVVSGQDFGTELVARFGLTGEGAHAARVLFASPTQVQGGIGLLGLVILVSSILSFARALERVYLDTWQLPAADTAAVRSRLKWLVGLIVYLVVLSPLKTGLNGLGAESAMRFVSAVGASALFLWTPSVLLGGRVPWRRLLPTAAVTGGAILVLGIGSAIVMPGVVSHNTERYGLIGFTFSMVSWLFVAALVVIAAAVLGKLLDDELARHRRVRAEVGAAGPPESGDVARAGRP
jgi:membrane protein